MALTGATGAPRPPTRPPIPNSPTQFLPPGPSSKPALQTHRKLPSVLMQRPWRQRLLPTRHSSTSAVGGRQQAVRPGLRPQIRSRQPRRPRSPVDSHTHARLLGGRRLEALVALAVVGARGVDAVSVVAGVAGAFVHVCGQTTLSPRPPAGAAPPTGGRGPAHPAGTHRRTPLERPACSPRYTRSGS